MREWSLVPHGMQHPTPALAPGGTSRRCSGFTLDTRAVVMASIPGLWAGLQPPRSPRFPSSSLFHSQAHQVLQAPTTAVVLASPGFSAFSPRAAGRSGSSLLLDILAAALTETGQAQGWDVAQTFFLTQNHQLKAHFTWPALCSLCLML